MSRRARIRFTQLATGLAVLSFDVTDAASAARPDAGPHHRSLPLTKAQHAVARLAVQGKTNQEIADDLGIAVRTVANHMAAILVRTGAPSRYALARLMSGSDRAADAG